MLLVLGFVVVVVVASANFPPHVKERCICRDYPPSDDDDDGGGGPGLWQTFMIWLNGNHDYHYHCHGELHQNHAGNHEAAARTVVLPPGLTCRTSKMADRGYEVAKHKWPASCDHACPCVPCDFNSTAVLACEWTAEVQASETVVVNCSATTDPDEGDAALLTYIFDFGNGDSEVGASPVAEYEYLVAANYTITVAAVDPCNNTAEIDLPVVVTPYNTTECFLFEPTCNSVLCEGESFPCYTGPQDTKGVGLCVAGNETCTNGTLSGCIGEVTPQPEQCDAIDHDCDGDAYNGFPLLGQSCSVGIGACLSEGVFVCNAYGNATECDAIPGTPTPELCGTGIDEDCNGDVDEGYPLLGQFCTVGVGACTANGTYVCNQYANDTECSAVAGTPSPEVCGNLIDEDCDGQLDNGFNFQNDTQNCGACGVVCAFNETCIACICTPANQTDNCGGCAFGLSCCGINATSCYNLTNNVNNCGACGNVCPSIGGAPNCVSGVCGVTACNPGLADCDNDGSICETNIDTDVNNCGGCGLVCNLENVDAHVCSSGSCTIVTCDDGWGDCDTTDPNGCETPLGTDSNCASCGDVCVGNSTCTNNTCVFLPPPPAGSVCGNGLVESPEGCDDGNVLAGDGCAANCTVEAGYTCVGNLSLCEPTPLLWCRDADGDGFGDPNVTLFSPLVTTGEYQIAAPFGYVQDCSDCDDTLPGTYPGGVEVADGVDNDCNGQVDDNVQGNVCGDGVLAGAEFCDDGNSVSSDGCSASCTVEAGYICPTPNVPCILESCGGACAANETCDSGTCRLIGCPLRTCQGSVYECGDCIDNDADTFVDVDDASCLNVCNNNEAGYYTEIPSQNLGTCDVDCWWDGDFGAGNDNCIWNLECDILEPGFVDECFYDENAPLPLGATCASARVNQSEMCLQTCQSQTPPGCDCFGCCRFPDTAGVAIYLGSEDGANNGLCTPSVHNNTALCKPCTQNLGCVVPMCVGVTCPLGETCDENTGTCVA